MYFKFPQSDVKNGKETPTMGKLVNEERRAASDADTLIESEDISSRFDGKGMDDVLDPAGEEQNSNNGEKFSLWPLSPFQWAVSSNFIITLFEKVKMY